MPTPANTIEISWSEEAGIQAKLWDGNGDEHDFTPCFQKVSGATGVGAMFSKLMLVNGDISTTLEYRPTSKELKFVVADKVIRQILEVHS